MNITKVNVFKNSGGSKIVANATVVVDDCLWLTGIKVIEGSEGYFIGFPSKKVGEEYKDIYFMNKATKAKVQDAILSEYNRENNGGGNPTPSSTKNGISDNIDDDSFPFIAYDAMLG